MIMTREEAAKTLTELWGVDYRYCLGTIGVEAVDMAGEALHQPERKKGKWKKNDNGTYSCSLCQSWIPSEQHYYAKYCLHCGAKMEVEKCKQKQKRQKD